jgi:low temperature requirement protein LtrA
VSANADRNRSTLSRLSRVAVQARRQHGAEEARASYMELFFDLVFVLVVTQLSALLLHDPSWRGFARMFFLLLAAWWAWIYTTWTTNWFDPDTLPVRIVLLVGMVASMLGAVSIPHAFGSRALVFVIGYIGLQLVRNTFVLAATDPDDPLYLPLIRFWRWNAAVGALWLAGAFVGHDTRIVVWTVALVLDYVGPFAGHWTPRLGRTAAVEWKLVPSHFAERIYLFVIIALGESIIATGTFASRHALTPARTLALMEAVLITAAFWWLYFDYHARRAQQELEAAGDDRGRLGRDLTYVHVPILAGIIVAAVGSLLVVRHPGASLRADELAIVATGPVLYLIGGIALKIRILGVLATQRLVAVLLVCGAAALGAVFPAAVVWGIVLVIFTALAALETQERFQAAMQINI